MPSQKRLRGLLVCAAICLLCNQSGFVGQPPARSDASRRSAGEEYSLWDELADSLTAGADDYKEMDRRNRRDVFGYEDWKRHRSTGRYFKNLFTTFSASSFAKFIWVQTLMATLVAAAVCLYYEVDLPKIQISSLPFTSIGGALSLLLVFRTNNGYDRWWEARKVWGDIVNKTRDLVRQSLARVEDETLRRELTGLSVAYPRSLQFHLGAKDKEAWDLVMDDMYRLLSEADAARVMSAEHKPMTILGLVTEKLEVSGMDSISRMKADDVCTALTDDYGKCERIFKSPIPLAYTRLTSRFLSIWVLGLPWALYKDIAPHALVVPITAIIAFFIFGIAELGIQIEEPFSILPLRAMGSGIEASCFEALEIDLTRRKSELLKELVTSRAPQP